MLLCYYNTSSDLSIAFTKFLYIRSYLWKISSKLYINENFHRFKYLQLELLSLTYSRDGSALPFCSAISISLASDLVCQLGQHDVSFSIADGNENICYFTKFSWSVICCRRCLSSGKCFCFRQECIESCHCLGRPSEMLTPQII